jgi:TolA-binding protein
MRDCRETILNLTILIVISLVGCSHHNPKKVLVKEKPKTVTPLGVEGESLVDSTHNSLHAYFEGLQYRAQGQQDKAIEAFTRFMHENPDHVYSDRAQYLIVDSYLISQEYHLAVVASYQFEKQFPESQKLPQALYQRGLAQHKLGQQEQSLYTFQSIVQHFSRSSVAEMAENKINEIKKAEEQT